MSNVGSDALLKFGKISLNSYSIVRYHKLSSIYSTQTDRLACSSLVSRCNNVTIAYNPCCSQVMRVQNRPLSEKAGDDQGKGSAQEEDAKHREGPEGYSSSSSSHNRYHRQSYERRRNHYENNDHSQSKSSTAEANNLSIMENHYQRLNIQLDADLDTIKSAYYSLSKIYHPDIVGSNDKVASENFRLITESYDTLSDPQLKADYDNELQGSSNNIVVDAKDLGRSPGRPNNNFNVIYRMRDTEMFFRAKQEAALRREKILNPKKFRAGSFIKSDDDPDEQLARLQKRMDRLHSSRSDQRNNPHDGSDFYREHLLNSMHRQREDLQLHATLRKQKYDEARGDTLSALVVLGALPVFVITALLFTYCDFAGDLDNLLEPKDSTSQKDQS